MPENNSIDPLASLGAHRKALWHLTVRLCHFLYKRQRLAKTAKDGSKISKDVPGMPENNSIDPLASLGALRKALWHLTVHLCHFFFKRQRFAKTGKDGSKISKDEPGMPENNSIDPLASLGALAKTPVHSTGHLCHF